MGHTEKMKPPKYAKFTLSLDVTMIPTGKVKRVRTSIGNHRFQEALNDPQLEALCLEVRTLLIEVSRTSRHLDEAQVRKLEFDFDVKVVFVPCIKDPPEFIDWRHDHWQRVLCLSRALCPQNTDRSHSLQIYNVLSNQGAKSLTKRKHKNQEIEVYKTEGNCVYMLGSKRMAFCALTYRQSDEPSSRRFRVWVCEPHKAQPEQPMEIPHLTAFSEHLDPDHDNDFSL